MQKWHNQYKKHTLAAILTRDSLTGFGSKEAINAILHLAQVNACGLFWKKYKTLFRCISVNEMRTQDPK
jgi:hypothetical protein